MNATDGVPFLDFNGTYQLLPSEEKKDGTTHSPGSSFSSTRFNGNPGDLGSVYICLFGRDNQEIANHIRSTFSSSSFTGGSSLQSTAEISSTQVDARRLFCCIKEKNPFQITCHTNTNYELSGYGREIRIKYCQDDHLLLMGYSVALLDFLYRNNKEEKVSEGDYLPIVLQANNATSDDEFNRVLQDRASLETMIVWFKTMMNPEASYRFDKQSLPAIEKLFNAVGLPINVAKQKKLCFIYPGPKPYVEEIFQDQQSCGELIMRDKNQVSYFSGYLTT